MADVVAITLYYDVESAMYYAVTIRHGQALQGMNSTPSGACEALRRLLVAAPVVHTAANAEAEADFASLLRSQGPRLGERRT